LENNITVDDSKGSPLKVFFDGECPLCRREIAWLRSRKQRSTVEYLDITAPDFNAENFGFSQQELMSEIRGLLGNRKIVGMDVFRELYSRVGLGWVLWVTNFPPFRQLADILYTLFAKNRLRLTGRCDNSC